MKTEEFTQRVQRVRERLYRTAYLYLGREHDALEAVDEAVYRAFRSQFRLREAAFFETWITRVLINLCKDELRRRNRGTLVAAPPEAEASPERLDSLPLREAVAALPEPLRAVVVLRYFTGLTLEETAAALKIPRGTVSTRQKRALELLRLELTEEEEENL